MKQIPSGIRKKNSYTLEDGHVGRNSYFWNPKPTRVNVSRSYVIISVMCVCVCVFVWERKWEKVDGRVNVDVDMQLNKN
jgi:hypothetical protein